MKSWLQAFRKNWEKLFFLLSLLFFVFLFGLIVGEYKIFPYQVFNDARKAARDWIANYHYLHYTRIRPAKFIHPAQHEGSGVSKNLVGKNYDGLTFITSMWDHTNGMNLIDMDGTIIHQWRVKFNDIWPTAPHLKKPIDDWDVDIHGALLYPNGDVVFNFEYNGLVKIDKCSNVIWKLPRLTHHSIHEDAQGNLWVPGRKIRGRRQQRLPLLLPPIKEDYILKISPEGKVLKEVSILDVFFSSAQEALLFANSRWSLKKKAGDITHVNDIEILDASIAKQFPLFEAGDIMVSMRVLNLIIVIDARTEKIKWAMVGPYLRQHDADFLENGHISVYDNRDDSSSILGGNDINGGKILGGSRILGIDPVTRRFYTIYQGDERNSFYSAIRGRQ